MSDGSLSERPLLEAIASSPLVASLAARTRFPAGVESVWCAVSGGADSTALAVLSTAVGRGLALSGAADTSGARRFRTTLMHIDHGLRPESSSDVVAVAALADALGVGMVSHRIAVGTGPNLEERARNSRYALLPDDVCTGHTAEDLAETVLLHLMRGAGLDGIASMARPRPGGVQRPLLALRRAETEALCASLGLSTVTDAMNTDPQFRRVRVRREVLPLLDDVAERDVVPLLARHAEVTADDVALLDELARGVDPTQRWGLRDVAPALARRAVRRWLVSSGVGGGRAVDAATIERVLAVAAGSTPRADVEGGWQVERTNGTLRLTRPSVE